MRRELSEEDRATIAGIFAEGQERGREHFDADAYLIRRLPQYPTKEQPVEQAIQQAPRAAASKCIEGCGRQVSYRSEGGRCMDCLIRLGIVDPNSSRAKRALRERKRRDRKKKQSQAPKPQPPIGFDPARFPGRPDPRTLEGEYLSLCVAEARRRLHEAQALGAAFAGQEVKS